MTNKGHIPKTARGIGERLPVPDRVDITDLRRLLERKRSVSVEAMNAAIVRQHSKRS